MGMFRQYDRRRILKGTATAGVAFPYVLRGASARQREESDVVVIGAGLSGLNAAWILTEQGYSVSVLEGSRRVGGRVNSVIKEDTLIEYGASEIGTQYARILSMVDQLGLELIDEDRDVMPFSSFLEGQLTAARDWQNSPLNRTVGDERAIAPNRLAADVIGRIFPLDAVDSWLDPAFFRYDISFAELFAQNGISDEALRLASLPVGLADPFNASALAMFQEFAPAMLALREKRGKGKENFPGTGMMGKKKSVDVHNASESGLQIWNIKGGTSLIPEGMAKLLSRPVHFGKLAMRIDMDEAGVDVYCMDGSHYRAKYVVSAIPFHLLRLIDVNPDFSGKQLDAVINLGHSNTSRFFLRFKEPFWEEDGLEPSMITDSGIGALWVIDNHKGYGSYRGMLNLTGLAASRMDAIPQEQLQSYALNELARIRPSTKGKVEILGFKSWAKDPFVRACRHTFKPGQVSEFAIDMILPWKRMHFAGEHTRRLEIGMEAAMESGERAAIDILELLA